MSSVKKPPPGIMNFWTKPVQSKQAEPTKKQEVSNVIYQGQHYQLILPSLSNERANEAMGAFFKALFTESYAVKQFSFQGIYLNPILGPSTKLQFGGLILYAKTSSLKPEINQKMVIDRIVAALNRCNAEMLMETIGLRIVFGGERKIT